MGVPGLRHHRRRPPAAVRHAPISRVQAGGRVVLREGGNAPGRGARRAHHHPLVQPVHRSTVAPGRPRRHRHHQRRVLNWEAAYGPGYRIDVVQRRHRLDPDLHHHHRQGRRRDAHVTGTGRYVRLYGTARATGYGYSLWEFQVFGTVDTAVVHPADAVRPDQAARHDRAVRAVRTRPTARWSPTPAGRRCPGRRSAGAARYEVWINISRTDYDFTAVRQPARPLHQGRRAHRHQLHADVGPPRPLDLQVVRRRRSTARAPRPRPTSAPFSVYLPDRRAGRRRREHRQRRPRPQQGRRDRAVRGLAPAGRDAGERPARAG